MDKTKVHEENEVPTSRPAMLRAVADWLDATDWVVEDYITRYGSDDEKKVEALKCVQGKQMQQDLRDLADDMERNIISSPEGERVSCFYLVAEWKEGGRGKFMEFLDGLEKDEENGS